MTLRAVACSLLALALCGCHGTDVHAEHEPVASKPAGAQADHAAHASPDRDRKGFELDVTRARGLGLSSALVEERDFRRSLRTVGIVALDETRTSRVHAKVRGFIESVSVDFVGKPVRRGQPLLTIYSQEVYAAELEFVSVLQQPVAGPGLSSALASAERQAREQLLAGARRRLSLWDVPKGEIARLERERTPRRTFTLTAPRSGIVVAKQALAGTFVDPSTELYLISDVKKLWVLADVYASDAPFVNVGSTASIQFEGAPATPLAAKVAFVPPTIDESTRTLKVRFGVDNPKGTIRPGSFATVEMDQNLGKGLSIPEDAVIHAGPRSIVFVLHGEHAEPRSVVVGPNVAGRYWVENGLESGERVATGAQFLLDSESRLRASSEPGGGHAGH